MDLSKECVHHLHDNRRGIRAEANCHCGVRERHEHCADCGYLLSIGDWDAPPIATWKINF